MAGSGEAELLAAAQELGRRLRAAGWRVAVAESLTAGHLQAAIASVPGASGWFLGGITAYALEQKVALLGVDRAQAAGVDCVSAEVARQMAEGVAARFGAEVSAATTGYAQAGGPAGRPMAFCAVRLPGQEIRVELVEFAGLDRREVQQAVARHTLRRLIEALRGQGLNNRGSDPM